MSRRLTLVVLAAGASLGMLLAGCAADAPAGPAAATASAGWTAAAELPRSSPLPEDQLSFDSDRTGNFELFTMSGDGTGARQLTDDARYDSWAPRVSPDRRTILFNRVPRGVHDRDYTQVSLWAVAADGTEARELRPRGLDGWTIQGHAEWAPDQQSLVMFGGPSAANPQIQLTDALGQHPRAITDRPGTNLDPAFTPDGAAVVFVGCPIAVCPVSSYEIYQVGVGGGEAQRLTDDDLRDQDPMYSPDGRQLAWLTNYGATDTGPWDVRIRDQQGPVRRLVGDQGITSRPEYSVDGRWIYVHRVAPGGSRFDVWRVRPDGSGLVNLTADQPGDNEFPGP